MMIKIVFILGVVSLTVVQFLSNAQSILLSPNFQVSTTTITSTPTVGASNTGTPTPQTTSTTQSMGETATPTPTSTPTQTETWIALPSVTIIFPIPTQTPTPEDQSKLTEKMEIIQEADNNEESPEKSGMLLPILIIIGIMWLGLGIVIVFITRHLWKEIDGE